MPIAYSKNIQKIIITYCFKCHNSNYPDSSFQLLDFPHVRRLLDSPFYYLPNCINGNDQYQQMPPNGSIPIDSCSKILLIDWIKNPIP